MSAGEKSIMDRPREIRRFRMLALTACLINVATTLIVLNFAVGSLAGAAIGAAISIGLILWISRGRSLIGRVLLTIWLAIGIVGAVASYALILFSYHQTTMSPAVNGLSLISLALNCAALVFLWSRAATAWLAIKPNATP
jgi:hypothetical protein